MSTSTNIKGVISKDDKVFKEYKEVAATCIKSGFKPPFQVIDYFKEYGIDVDQLNDEEFEIDLPEEAQREISGESYYTIEIDLEKLPRNVSKIRFCKSW